MRKFFLLLTLSLLLLSPWSSNRVLIAQVQGTVVAAGLNGPMGVLMDESGTLWIIESGIGGDEEVPFLDAQSGQLVNAQYGETAQVITVAPDGTQQVVTALPSIATGSDIIGGARLAQLDGKMYASIGQWLGDPTAAASIANMGVVAEINEGSATAVASTWDFERTQNPDGLLTDSHPYGLTASEEGVLWIVDAGGNALLRANPLTGRVRLVAVFAGLPSPFPNPARNNENLTDPVPTAVVEKDDQLFVSLLSGFPFTPGSAKVVTVAEDGSVQDYATGLTMLTDLQVGPDNELYAIQFAEFGDSGPTPNSGALVRVGAGDTSTVVLAGLSFPTALTFSPDGNAYVATNGVGAPGSGEVVMYTGVISATGVAASASMTSTPAITDTATLTESTTLTETAAVTETATITEAATVTETATISATATTTDTAVITETTPVSDTTAMSETMAVTDTEPITESATLSTTAVADTTTEETAEDSTPTTTPAVVPAETNSTVTVTTAAAAPESMPMTGGSLGQVNPMTLPIVALILVGLVASALLTRRPSESTKPD
ncbi:MAG: ScyD/ScyE family protein [Caldilineaceae bacterium]|nr:ScyD/ScyE family protein [Caldilineaceae bacterium]